MPVVRNSGYRLSFVLFGPKRIWTAAPGTGVIAGGAVRVIMQLAGIHDILTKSIRSSNPISVANATLAALRQVRNPEEVARSHGKAKGAL